MSEMQSHAGTCTRTHTQPPPVIFSVHSAGFIQVWLFLLPLGFSSTDYHFYLELISIVAVTTLMLGCDEVATQLGEWYRLQMCQSSYL